MYSLLNFNNLKLTHTQKKTHSREISKRSIKMTNSTYQEYWFIYFIFLFFCLWFKDINPQSFLKVPSQHENQFLVCIISGSFQNELQYVS